jgi:hypothetical protein
MTTIHLKGRITDTGELNNLLKAVPMTGAEIVQAGLLGGWADEGIVDSEAWVEELRRKRREQRPWSCSGPHRQSPYTTKPAQS